MKKITVLTAFAFFNTVLLAFFAVYFGLLVTPSAPVRLLVSLTTTSAMISVGRVGFLLRSAHKDKSDQ